MRVRRVDAVTGGPVTVKSAVVRYVGVELITAATPRQSLEVKDEARARRRATVVPELAEVAKQHAGDRVALIRAALRLCGKQDRGPLTYMAFGMGVPIGDYFRFRLVGDCSADYSGR